MKELIVNDFLKQSFYKFIMKGIFKKGYELS